MSASKRPSDPRFSDPSFPLLVVPRCTSRSRDIDTAPSAVHEAIEIKCFYESSSTLLVGNKAIRAEAGDIIVINPYEVHGTIDCGDGERGKYHIFMVGLDLFEGLGAGFADLRHLIFGERTVFRNHLPQDSEIYGLLCRAVSESERGDGVSRLALFGIMAEVFSALLRRGTESASPLATDSKARYYEVIEPALRMIRDGYRNGFTLDALADACLVSKYYFCRVFKAVMGMSAIQYINAYRLKIADALLANTELRISEVAAECGFEDANYFTRLYKSHFGKTPRTNAKMRQSE